MMQLLHQIPSFLADSSGTAPMPMLGRLVFAGVFALLILWLILMPKDRIKSETSSGKAALISAIVIASVQMAIYLLWR